MKDKLASALREELKRHLEDRIITSANREDILGIVKDAIDKVLTPQVDVKADLNDPSKVLITVSSPYLSLLLPTVPFTVHQNLSKLRYP